jgi:hypothetical protein
MALFLAYRVGSDDRRRELRMVQPALYEVEQNALLPPL